MTRLGRGAIAAAICAVVAMAAPMAAAPARARVAQAGGAGAGAKNPPPPRGQGARQGGARAGQPARGANAPGASAEQAEQLFDRAMMNQARKALNLDVAQFQAFRPRLEQLQTVRRRAQRERQMLIRDLNDLTTAASPVDDAAVNAKLKALDALDAASQEQVRAAHAALEEVLNPSQQARFRVFEQRMERQKLDLIQRARQQAAGAPPTPANP